MQLRRGDREPADQLPDCYHRFSDAHWRLLTLIGGLCEMPWRAGVQGS